MRGRRLLFVITVIHFIGHSLTIHCDMAMTASVQQGILGQTPDFNWLGVLRVHLHDGDDTQIALTGIVLIKDKYALANADDVARIPQRIFQSDTLAMFIPTDDTPWFVPPLSYVTHPEYQYSTLNSIAIVELNFSDDQDNPLNPICFPTFAYNTSSYLYLVGYTDEEKVLEKVFYKIQYLEKQVCEEFYNRAGLSDKNRLPTTYLCGYSPYNSTHCVWDNGMVLVSNATGWFTLIGFGVRGPGCAAPARFIDLAPYFSWINSVTSVEEELYDSVDYRRTQDDDEFVPIHKLFIDNKSWRRNEQEFPENGGGGEGGEGGNGGKGGDGGEGGEAGGGGEGGEAGEGGKGEESPATSDKKDYFKYPFDTEKPRMFNIESVDDEALAIFPFDTTWAMYNESCSARKTLIYHEIFEIRSDPAIKGVARYKLQMYDLLYKPCTCVILSVESTNRSQASLSFRERLDFTTGTQLGDSGETPEELFRYYPITERTVKPPVNGEQWRNPNMKPNYLKQKIKSGAVLNYVLYIKFTFTGKATLKFEMFSQTFTNTTMTTTEATTENNNKDNPRRMMNTVSKRKTTRKPFWGFKDALFRKAKEPEVTMQEVVHATLNDGHRCGDFPIVLLGCLVFSSCFSSYRGLLSLM